MASLVPGLEGDTLLEQMNKLFEPPGNHFFRFHFSMSYLSWLQATKGWTTWARLIPISRGQARVTTMIVVTLAKKEEHW